MHRGHQPEIRQLDDDRWAVECPECSAGLSIVPVGIGLPVTSLTVAEAMRDNHSEKRAG